jgi:hypothetical protein
MVLAAVALKATSPTATLFRLVLLLAVPNKGAGPTTPSAAPVWLTVLAPWPNKLAWPLLILDCTKVCAATPDKDKCACPLLLCVVVLLAALTKATAPTLALL